MSDPEFDPGGPGTRGLFGLDVTAGAAAVRVIAVPWEATASYGRGTAGAPAAVLSASRQVDLHDLEYGDFWRAGISMPAPDPRIADWARQAEPDALAVIAADGGLLQRAAAVDRLSERVSRVVQEQAHEILAAGSVPAVLGGDHSAPLGLLRAVAAAHPGVGILHIDAHADLRDGYLGFRWSHASIMHHALALPGVCRLVGVGYRDLCQQEFRRIQREPDRIRVFTDPSIARGLAAGETWLSWCRRVVEALPPEVYISFDIDGLDPSLCPNTGTPVPGGLSFRQAHLLLAEVSRARRVVAFDLCEVGTAEGGAGEWDANVGARVLYKLAGCCLRSRETNPLGRE